MTNTILKKTVGVVLLVLCSIAIASLLFFYSAVLFSEKWPQLKPAYDAFKLIFSVPTGLVVIYSTFIVICIPLLFGALFGASLITTKKYISKIGVVTLCGLWALAMLFGSVTVVHQVQQIVTRITPFSGDPVAFDLAKQIPTGVQYVFKTTLKNEVQTKLGTPIEGYEPQMFLDVFPGLTETDFERVEASIGYYTIEDGRLVHKTDDTKLIHSAAQAITDRGLDTLLANVSLRLQIDLTQNGTLTEIMEALMRYDQGEEPEVPEDDSNEGETTPIACTMDAKICPDGSAVGRQGPTCEFAPCPVATNKPVHVCTPDEKKAEACTMEYAPVCGLVAVQCVTTPCNPVPETFGNGCSACEQDLVTSYTQGACTQ